MRCRRVRFTPPSVFVREPHNIGIDRSCLSLIVAAALFHLLQIDHAILY
jgi:hypothetical protein